MVTKADRKENSPFYELWKVIGGGGWVVGCVSWDFSVSSAPFYFEICVSDLRYWISGDFFSFDTEQIGPGVGAGAELDNYNNKTKKWC